MYGFDTRIRYTECDIRRKLTLLALVDYFQDCSTFHSEDAGVGLDYMLANNTAWFLLNWQIEIDRMPEFGEKVKICTNPYGFKGFYGMRNFWIEAEDGTVIVKANTIWSYMDIANGRPKRIPEQDMENYGMGEPIDMEYAPRKMQVPSEWKHVGEVKVIPEMIDTNDHMNNAQYIRVAGNTFAAECASDNVEITQMLAEYKKSAKLGDTIKIYTAWEDGSFYVDMRDEEDKTYAVVALKQKANLY